MQIITDVAIDPAANVRVVNNWIGRTKASRMCLSQRYPPASAAGAVFFFGLAKPISTPLIGLRRAP